MKVFHAVAYGGNAPDRRFSQKATTTSKAVVAARTEAAALGYPNVFLEDAAGRRRFEGPSTECHVYFSDCDPDDDTVRDPSGGWYYQSPGAKTSCGPYASQSTAIQKAATA